MISGIIKPKVCCTDWGLYLDVCLQSLPGFAAWKQNSPLSIVRASSYYSNTQDTIEEIKISRPLQSTFLMMLRFPFYLKLLDILDYFLSFSIDVLLTVWRVDVYLITRYRERLCEHIKQS